ncbi:hypothetical protein CC78DRAFT_40960 [Lojkania enalia]|uniref:Thioredoxin domain-containing protein n=1 Tax=Lojkania enalia TaxID=147567 RepID=A0A9P4K2A9_9PLEO|nr:hypothetical protein CC78DRAFT_40960 [Didymosphaeria enalia]
MGVHKELNSKEDFESALATNDKYVFIFFYENEIPPAAEENAKKFAATTDAYSIDVGKKPEPKERFKITKVPTAVVYKDGIEVKRVDDMTPENMKEVVQMLSS